MKKLSRKEKLLTATLEQFETRLEKIKLLNSDLIGIATDLYHGLDTPTSLGLFLCLKYGDFDSVVKHEIDPRQYLDVDEFARSYQACSFLRKSLLKCSLDPVHQAQETFFEGERECLKTNDLLWNSCSAPSCMGHDVHEILHHMRRDIAAILRGFSPDIWMLSCAFGPGSVVHMPGSSVYDKVSAAPTVTREFASFGAALVNSSPAWVDAIRNTPTCPTDGKLFAAKVEVNDLRVVPGGTYCQVPKSAKTNRNIEVQPCLNAYAQLGIGKMIRQRLKESGLDLRTQQDKNRSAAGRGSRHGHLCTIDMSAASDTICYALVQELIPERWFHAMDLCRTSAVVMPDESVLQLERFSSMGNGYTFELESLIFWALARACRRVMGEDEESKETEIHVFGDDIICSPGVAKLLVEVCPFLGFTVNRGKTFVDGPFRESCGHDYFNGVNVRPYFFKKGEDDSDLQTIVSMANGLRRAARRCNHNFGCSRRFKRAWLHCLSRIPRDIRSHLIGFWSDEDRWLISDYDDVMRNPGAIYCRQLWQWICPSLTKRSVDRHPGNYAAARAAMLYKQERKSLTWLGDELVYNNESGDMEPGSSQARVFTVAASHAVHQHLDVTTTEVSQDMVCWL